MSHPSNSGDFSKATSTDPFQPPEREKSYVGVVILGLVLFFGVILLVCGGGIFFLLTSDFSTDKNEKPLATLDDLEVLVSEEFSAAKVALGSEEDVRQHPEYARVGEFVESLQKALNDDSSRRLLRRMDYEAMYDQIADLSTEFSRSSIYRSSTVSQLKEAPLAPSPFDDYKILHIDDSVENEFQVYLQYSIGYVSTETNVWRLKDQRGTLKLYDWCCLESGLSNASETALLLSCSPTDNVGQQRYIDDCNAYLEGGEPDEPYIEHIERVRRILRNCESYSGPRILKPDVQLITAKRWFDEGEFKSALDLIDRISTARTVPGVHRLRGDILYEQKEYAEAVECYKKHRELLGPTPQVQSDLVNCYLQLDNVAGEREILNEITDNIEEDEVEFVVKLIEINDAAQNRSLFKRIDELDDSESIYEALILRTGYSPYFAVEAKQLQAHVLKTMPNSKAGYEAGMKLAKAAKDYADLLAAIDKMPDEEAAEKRYNFWYEVPEKQLLEVFKASNKPTENFKTIFEVQEYDYLFDSAAMRELSEHVLESEPENALANLKLGAIHGDNKDYVTAKKYLNKAFELYPKDGDFIGQLKSRMNQMLYETDDETVTKFAEENDIVRILLNYKVYKKDFSNLEPLIELLDKESLDHMIFSTRLVAHEGNLEKAIAAVCKKLDEQPDDDDATRNANYQLTNLLIKLFEKQGNAYDAFERAPSEGLWDTLSQRALYSANWTACQQLIDTGHTEFQSHSKKLQQSVHWEKGEYKELLASSESVLKRARTEDMTGEIDELTRAALREGKLDEAKRFADKLREVNEFNLSALVAICQGDAEAIAKTLNECSVREAKNLRTDEDLIDVDLSSFESLNLLTPSLSYSFEVDRDIDFDIFFESDFVINESFIKRMLGKKFGNNLQVIENTSPTLRTYWSAKTDDWTLVFYGFEMTPNSAEDVEAEALKQAIAKTKFYLKVCGYAKRPTVKSKTRPLEMKLIQQLLSQENSLAVGRYNHWLDRESFQTGVKAERESGFNHIFKLELPGEYYYAFDGEADEDEAVEHPTFSEDLIAELRKFNADKSNRQMVLYVMPDPDLPTTVKLEVNQIRRQLTSGVQLIATVIETNGVVPFLTLGQRVQVPFDKVDGFEVIDSDGKVVSERHATK